MGKRAFWVLVSVVLLLGIAAGYRLSALPRLETYKLLNVAGLSYSFLGVLILSELLAANAKWKNICVNFLAPGVLWFHFLFPLGALFGAVVPAQMTHKPSSAVAEHFLLAFNAYSMIPLSIFNEVVVLPKLPFLKRDVDTRWRWFGLFLLLSGVLAQLIAALLAIAE